MPIAISQINKKLYQYESGILALEIICKFKYQHVLSVDKYQYHDAFYLFTV